MNKGLRNFGEKMGSDEILREVEYSSLAKSKVHDFKINERKTITLTVPPTVYPPRRDTELLLEGLQYLKIQSGHMVEIGCGSGAISIAMALAGWNVTSFDVNPFAVVATKGNSEIAGVNDRVTVEEGGIGEENWEIPTKADVVVWNLPYLAPDFQNTLGPMEEAALSDEWDLSWSERLLELVDDDNQRERVFVLLMNVDSNPKNSSLVWTRKGWARRTLAAERVGDDTLEVVAFWRPGLGSEPASIDSTESTMDEVRKLPNKCWQRIRAREQIAGRGRRGANWHSNIGDMIASWSVGKDVLNWWTPGLLQVSIGASISEALGVQLKWPNDLIYEGKKCGGILLESSTAEESVRIGVGLNKWAGEFEGVSYSGWTDYFGEIEAEEIFQIIDASIASILDSTPPIPSTENLLWRQKSWMALSDILSTGSITKFNGDSVKVVGLADTGGLKAVSETSTYDIQDVGGFFISS
ncbi:MAG: 50S ribosomal protein L11 methyltransferase [Candidatus Thermoplasmatota archaeon]|nr:50S ribosomal protein L11 methyltransferase [Candidatus Thermoplasmatota archaeon]